MLGLDKWLEKQMESTWNRQEEKMTGQNWARHLTKANTRMNWFIGANGAVDNMAILTIFCHTNPFA